MPPTAPAEGAPTEDRLWLNPIEAVTDIAEPVRAKVTSRMRSVPVLALGVSDEDSGSEEEDIQVHNKSGPSSIRQTHLSLGRWCGCTRLSILPQEGLLNMIGSEFPSRPGLPCLTRNLH